MPPLAAVYHLNVGDAALEDAAVKVVEVPEQIDVLPVIPLKTGINLTTTTIEPDTVLEHNVALASFTETNA